MKIISCAGFGNTGSSIITNFFEEFSCVRIFGGSSFEFMLLHEADGIFDLEKALTEGHRLKTDLAIKRFLKLVKVLDSNNPSGPNYKDFFSGKFLELTNEYLCSLGIVKWNNGWWHRIFEIKPENKLKKIILQENFNRIAKGKSYSLYEPDTWKPSYTNYTAQYFGHITQDEFRKQTKLYLSKLFEKSKEKMEWVLFDQLFPTNCDDYLCYFDYAKSIIVDRDPRDLYFANKVFWGNGFIPSENVEVFIDWFKKTRSEIKTSENILYLKFEDMVYNTEKTQSALCEFVGIDKSLHDKWNTCLFVDKSKNNTALFKKFHLIDEIYGLKIEQDLKKIEDELKDFLFDFSEHINFDSIVPQNQEFIFEKVMVQAKHTVVFTFPKVICKIIILLAKKIWRKFNDR